MLKLVEGTTLKGTTHPCWTHDKVGTCLRSYLGLRLLLLWHSGEANRSHSCVPWNQLWQQNHMILTKCCLTQRGGSHCNSHSDEQCSETNCHRWSGSSSVHSNLTHNEQHTTKTNIHYNNFVFLMTVIPVKGQMILPAGATLEV